MKQTYAFYLGALFKMTLFKGEINRTKETKEK